MAAAACFRAASSALCSTSGRNDEFASPGRTRLVRPAGQIYGPGGKSQFAVRAAKEEPEKRKQSLFTSITDALDFAQVRSEEDARLIDEGRRATSRGEKMSDESVGALKRKIGGTAKDFFKEWVDVQGDYVEDGWVDKTCMYCKKDTSDAPRQKDAWGRYAHIECADNKKKKGFFGSLFG